MVDFKSLKKSSADISRLSKELEKINSNTNSSADERFWYPEVDKAGNGYAVIRLLPAPFVDGDEALPWVRVFRHAFKGPSGKWYIENSLTTIGQKDPVSELNSKLWNSADSDESPERKQARDQKRKVEYISNIEIISYPINPELNGQLKLFRYGQKIFNKISMAMNPEFEDETPFNPFDFWTGANLKIKIKNVAGYRNYDSSEFDTQGPLSNDDDYLEELWKREYSLKEFVDHSKFKTYDELKARLEDVLELNKTFSGRPTAPVAKTKVTSIPDIEDDVPFDTGSETATEEDDDMAYFRSLARD